MTFHNLSAHLSWLLGTKPFAILPTPRSPQGSGTPEWAEKPDTQSASPVLDQRKSPVDQVVASGHGADLGPRNPEFARPALPARLVSGGEINSMARLQSGPKSSTKPRLLSQASPCVLNTPTTGGGRASGTSLKDQYSAHYRQNGKSSFVSGSRACLLTMHLICR